jgi:hypothetical protein
MSHKVPEDRWQEVDSSAPHALSSFSWLADACESCFFKPSCEYFGETGASASPATTIR